MFLITAGIITAITATTTTTIATATGIGVAAGIVKKVADYVEEENYASIQRAKKTAKNEIRLTEEYCNNAKESVKNTVLFNMREDIDNSTLNTNSKDVLINKINLPAYK